MAYIESDLIIPALKLLRAHREGLTTSEIIEKLTEILKPTGKDLESYEGRTDTIFSQTVRNLISSHRNLERKGVATFKDGISKITDTGLRYLEENEVVLDSLKSQGFKPDDIEEEVERDYSGIIIEEGALERTTTTQRRRSQKLREIKIREFKRENDNTVFCSACGFDFSEVYGERGKNFIEIHHTSLLHEEDIEGSSLKLFEALKKVVLLCSNCHRMVHRKRNEMLSTDDLKRIIQENRGDSS